MADMRDVISKFEKMATAAEKLTNPMERLAEKMAASSTIPFAKDSAPPIPFAKEPPSVSPSIYRFAGEPKKKNWDWLKGFTDPFASNGPGPIPFMNEGGGNQGRPTPYRLANDQNQPDPGQMGPQAPSWGQRMMSNFQSWGQNWRDTSKQVGQDVKGQTRAINMAGNLAQQAGIPKAAQITDIAGKAARAAGGDTFAMAELAAMKAKQSIEDISKFGDVLTSKNAMQGGANMMHGMSGVASAVDPTGMMAAPLKFGAVLMESVNKLQAWNNELHMSNMRFADYSASMAGVQAQQQVRDMQMSRERGDAISDSARYNAEAKSRLDRSLMPLENAFDRLKNNVGGALADVTAQMIEAGNEMLKILGLGGPSPTGNMPGNAWAYEFGHAYTRGLVEQEIKDRPLRMRRASGEDLGDKGGGGGMD